VSLVIFIFSSKRFYSHCMNWRVETAGENRALSEEEKS
jgi:hypothetical protein